MPRRVVHLATLRAQVVPSFQNTGGSPWLIGLLLVICLATPTISEGRQDGRMSGVVARVRALHEAGALTEAHRIAREALDATRDEGAFTAERVALRVRLGLVLADLGRLADAYAEILPLTTTSPGGGVDAHLALAALHLHRHDGRAALEAVTRAETRDRPPHADLLRGLALLEAGDAAAGTSALEAWLAQAEPDASDLSGARIDAHIGLARAALAATRMDEAATHLAAARRDADAAGHRLRLAETLLLDGRRRRQVGDTAGADAVLRDALAIARAAPLPRVTAGAAHALYESAAARGATNDALEYLRLHTDARLRLASDSETGRLIALLASARRDGVETLPAEAAPAAPETETDGGADVVRLLLLVTSLAALVLAAVLWRVGYTRGRRALHYRQELEALKGTITQVAALDGLITICASCKDICRDDGEWTRIEAYLAARLDARFTHSICPTCEERVLAGAEDATHAGHALAGDETAGDVAAPLQGGFDWPPSDEELARVLRAAEADQDAPAAAPRGGRWA